MMLLVMTLGMLIFTYELREESGTKEEQVSIVSYIQKIMGK